MRKVVLTGGAYAGKTSLAARLGELGFAVVPEAAIRLIRALDQERGPREARHWRRRHRREFQTRIAELQARLEADAEASGALIAVCDRGLHDGIAYCRHWGIDVPEPVARAARGTRYDRVFVLDTLSSFEARAESGRIDDRADSLRVRDLVQQAYREHAHEPVFVPELPLEERLERVRRSLESL